MIVSLIFAIASPILFLAPITVGSSCWVEVKGNTYKGEVAKNASGEFVCRVVVGGLAPIDIPQGKFSLE